MLKHDASGGKKVHPWCYNTTPVVARRYTRGAKTRRQWGQAREGSVYAKGVLAFAGNGFLRPSATLCVVPAIVRGFWADVGASVGLAGLSAPRRSTVSASRFSCPLRGLFRPGSWSLFLSTSCASLGARSAPSWTLRAVGLVADEKRPVRGRTLAPVLLGLGTRTVPCTPEQEHVSWGTRP